MVDTPILTELVKEKINCKAYDKLYKEMQSFIRTRHLNSEADPGCTEELIKIVIELITQTALDSFYRSYLFNE